MAYEKQTWVTGEVITKEKLNHMEDGIADSGGVIVAEEDSNEQQLNKTWQEICDALSEKKQVYIYAHRLLGDDEFVTIFEPACTARKEFIGGDVPEYEYYIYTPTTSYIAESNNGYPVKQ